MKYFFDIINTLVIHAKLTNILLIVLSSLRKWISWYVNIYANSSSKKVIDWFVKISRKYIRECILFSRYNFYYKNRLPTRKNIIKILKAITLLILFKLI